MIGVLLVNMGYPSSQKELKHFLFKMFCDSAILPFPKLFRIFLAFIISNARYKKSWKKYELIGGSPLKESMNLINDSLSKVLGSEYTVYSAYSYSLPNIKNGLDYFYKKEIKEIKVIPMYPQSSFSTTGSIKKDIENFKKRYKDIHLTVIENYFENKNFINFWTFLINEIIKKNNFKNPILLFSAHAIPQYQIEKGDTYVHEVNKTALNIATEIGLRYKISFQSKIGKIKWIEPDTKFVLNELKNEGCNEILIVPISFINENLETLFDLDLEIIPYGKNILNIKNLCRVDIPKNHSLLIDTFKNLIIKN
jgi:ferrochelatase